MCIPGGRDTPTRSRAGVGPIPQEDRARAGDRSVTSGPVSLRVPCVRGTRVPRMLDQIRQCLPNDHLVISVVFPTPGMPADRRRPTRPTMLGRLRVPVRRAAPTAGRRDTTTRSSRTHVRIMHLTTKSHTTQRALYLAAGLPCDGSACPQRCNEIRTSVTTIPSSADERTLATRIPRSGQRHLTKYPVGGCPHAPALSPRMGGKRRRVRLSVGSARGCHPRLPVTTRDAREPPAPQGPSRSAVALRASPCPPGEPPGMAAPARPNLPTPRRAATRSDHPGAGLPAGPVRRAGLLRHHRQAAG